MRHHDAYTRESRDHFQIQAAKWSLSPPDDAGLAFVISLPGFAFTAHG